MKIIGTHDELMALKLSCQKNGDCDYCVLRMFCLNSKESKKTIFDFLTIEKFETIFIGGDNHEKQ